VTLSTCSFNELYTHHERDKRNNENNTPTKSNTHNHGIPFNTTEKRHEEPREEANDNEYDGTYQLSNF